MLRPHGHTMYQRAAVMANQLLSGTFALFVLACYGVAWCSAAAEVQFDYDNQTAWLDLVGSQCGGNRQSPINIIADQAVTNSSYGQLRMLGWTETVSGQLLNTGRTVKFVPGQKDATTITQRGEYTVDLFHFHWGNASSVGSEHRVDGMQFDGELHFVHTKSNPRRQLILMAMPSWWLQCSYTGSRHP